MSKSMTESQIVSILKEAESGMLVKELCREYDIGNSTFYKWHEVLDLYIFKNLQEVVRVTEDWMEIFNTERPHNSRNDMTPI